MPQPSSVVPMQSPAHCDRLAYWSGARRACSIGTMTTMRANDSKPSKIQPMKLAARIRQCIAFSPVYQG